MLVTDTITSICCTGVCTTAHGYERCIFIFSVILFCRFESEEINGLYQPTFFSRVLNFLNLFFLRYVSARPSCMSVHHVLVWYTERPEEDKPLGSLEVKSQMVVSSHVGAGSQT